MVTYSRNRLIINGDMDDSLLMLHLEKGRYFSLDGVAKRIWELVECPKGFEELISDLMIEFEVSETQCRHEVVAFLDKAIQDDILIRHDATS
ncbi:MAG: PqqD family peptide modification chaperone [Proteobacteria bacterium]|nr:PqqD family peptide modification chaperone [Pseudomonadota bacterium]